MIGDHKKGQIIIMNEYMLYVSCITIPTAICIALMPIIQICIGYVNDAPVKKFWIEPLLEKVFGKSMLSGGDLVICFFNHFIAIALAILLTIFLPFVIIALIVFSVLRLVRGVKRLQKAVNTLLATKGQKHQNEDSEGGIEEEYEPLVFPVVK